jgi:tetratricopeptide (TPR) repeat protein
VSRKKRHTKSKSKSGPQISPVADAAQTSHEKTAASSSWRGLLAAVSLLALAGVAGTAGVKAWRSGAPKDNSAAVPQFTSFAGGSQLPADHWSDPETCRKCHAEEYDDWAKSNHANANRVVDAATDVAAFQQKSITIDDGAERFEFMSGDGKFTLAVSGSAVGGHRFPVEGVIAIEPLRQFLLATGSGRYQTTPVAWDVKRGEWFHVFPGERRVPGTWGHWLGQGMNWNSNCATCHMTEFKKNLDVATGGYRSIWRFQGISCVQCHTEADTHAMLATWGFTKAANLKFTTAQKLDSCGSCHSRREQLTADEFRAGDNYHDHHRLALPDQGGLYHDDGQILEEDFELGSFAMSRMGGKAGVICLDCHKQHSLATKLPVENNTLCLLCHGTGLKNAPRIDPAAHSHHKTDSAGNQCVNCHMPTTVYMARDPRHDHGFLSPDPRLTKELGIPNACDRCHKDKGTDWDLEAAEKWYGPEMNKRTRERARIMHRARTGNPAAASEIAALIVKEEVPAWRATFVGLLAPFIADERAFAAASNALHDSSPLVRARAVHVLAEHPQAAGAIAALENDPARTVRLEVAFARRAELKPGTQPMRELLAYLAANADRPGQSLMAADLAATQKRPDEAARLALHAVSLDPQNALTLRDAAVVLARAEKLDEAQRLLEGAVKVSPDFADAHYSLGLLRAERGDLAGTVESLRATVRLDPENARAWYNLALALTKQERWAEALPAIESAEARLPGSQEVLYTKAIILARLGRKTEAEAILRTLPR